MRVLCGLLWADTSLHGNLQEATLPCKCLTLTTRDASTCFQVCEHLAAAWTGMTHTFSQVSYWEFVRFLSPPLYRNHACSTTKTRYMETWQSCSFSKHWAVALVSLTLISVRAEFGTAVWEFTRLIAFSVHKEITLKKCQSSCKKMIVLFRVFALPQVGKASWCLMYTKLSLKYFFFVYPPALTPGNWVFFIMI